MYVYVRFCNRYAANVFHKLFADTNAEQIVTYGAHIRYADLLYVQCRAASVTVNHVFFCIFRYGYVALNNFRYYGLRRCLLLFNRLFFFVQRTSALSFSAS